MATAARELTRAQRRLTAWRELEGDVTALAELENLEPGGAWLAAERARLEAALASFEDALLFRGPHDDRPALVTVTPGAGGDEAADWAGTLTLALARYAKRVGLEVEVLEWRDHQASRENGVDTATLHLHGPHAYGWLRSEHGVHRLTRVSPYDRRSRRHTTFAAVDVTPGLPPSPAVTVAAGEVRVDVFRASGPGGQGVNTTDSAVRLTYHAGQPDELTVACQTSRSQQQNRARAWQVLHARLAERHERQAQEAAMAARGEQPTAAWGHHIRSYKLDQGYVLDHRTGHQTWNPSEVLAGGLEPFARVWLTLGRGARQTVAVDAT